MASSISLHVGPNSVVSNHYDGWDGQLAACEADAKDMAAIAKKQGFATTSILLTKKAKVLAVPEAIQSAAKNLAGREVVLLTYSGLSMFLKTLSLYEIKYSTAQSIPWLLGAASYCLTLTGLRTVGLACPKSHVLGCSLNPRREACFTLYPKLTLPAELSSL